MKLITARKLIKYRVLGDKRCDMGPSTVIPLVKICNIASVGFGKRAAGGVEKICPALDTYYRHANSVYTLHKVIETGRRCVKILLASVICICLCKFGISCLASGGIFYQGFNRRYLINQEVKQ